MIISHRHRFIFLKTKKTGGTSLEIALSRLCGPDDIITPITDSDEVIRREAGGVAPRNYLEPWPEYRPRDMARLILRGRRKVRFWNHMTAAEVMARIPRSTWDEYFTFCFERDPVDRILSMVAWKSRKRGVEMNLERFVERNLSVARDGGWGIYTIDDIPVVDRVYRYEDLGHAVDDISDRIGVPIGPLPRAKSGIRSESLVVPDDVRKTIERYFSREMELFGYPVTERLP